MVAVLCNNAFSHLFTIKFFMREVWGAVFYLRAKCNVLIHGLFLLREVEANLEHVMPHFLAREL